MKVDPIRTFIAIEMPSSIRRNLAEIRKKLDESGANVKWVAEKDYHVTLKFLGNVSPRKLENVFAAAESALIKLSPFKISLKGTGSFKRPGRPRVIWAGIDEGAQQLADLAGQIDTALKNIGFEPEQRPFAPHITIGRARTPITSEPLVALIKEHSEEELGSFTIKNVSVFKSELKPDGPVYTILREFIL